MNLEEIKQRELKATKGPWRAGDCNPYNPKQRNSFADFGAYIYGPALDSRYPDDTAIIVKGGLQDEQGGAVGVLLPQDAEFIAHARQDIPALLAEVERLQILNQQYRQALLESGWQEGKTNE